MRWEDVRALSDLFVGRGTEKTGILQEQEATRQLIWLPFFEKGIYFRDAILNSGIQKAKIRSPKLHMLGGFLVPLCLKEVRHKRR